MKTLSLLALAVLFAGPAHAGIPQMNVVCGDGIEVHADEGGPVYIAGKEAKLKKFNDNYYEAKHDHTTVSISINPDGSASASYTGRHRANGMCRAQDFSAAGAASSSASGSGSSAESACQAAVAKQVGDTDPGAIRVLGSEASQAGTSVRVSVPGAQAPWACVIDTGGSVSRVYYTEEG